MLRRKSCAHRATMLLSICLSFASVTAFAQKTANPLLPNVNLGLTVPKIVEVPRLPVEVPKVPLVEAPKLPSVEVPRLPLIPPLKVDVSVTVPSVGGLTPPIDAKVNVNTGSSGPLLGTGLSVGGSGAPGSPPVPETYSPTMAGIPQDQLAARRIDLLPTCR